MTVWTRRLDAFRHLRRLPEVLRCWRTFQRPGSVLLNYLGLKRSGYPQRVRLRSGLTFNIETFHDLVTLWVVFVRSEYPVLARHRTVLDIGANFGAFSVRMASEISAARVIAAEPFGPTFRSLLEHVEENGLEDRVHAWNVGAAAVSGVRFMPAAHPVSQSIAIFPESTTAEPGRDVARVEVLSLTEIISRACRELDVNRIDYMKMDIEGGEHEVLLSTPAEVLEKVGALALEYHPNGSKSRLFDHLRAAGLHLLGDRVFAPDSGVAYFERR